MTKKLARIYYYDYFLRKWPKLPLESITTNSFFISWWLKGKLESYTVTSLLKKWPKLLLESSTATSLQAGDQKIS